MDLINPNSRAERLLKHIQAHDTLQAQPELLTTIVGVEADTAARVLASGIEFVTTVSSSSNVS